MPLSSVQRRFWFLARLAPTLPLHYVHLRLYLEGGLDARALEGAVLALARRHESLRTVFPPSAEGCPGQQVLDAPGFALVMRDAGEDALDDLAREHAREPFNVERGPLSRWTLVRVATHRHALLLTLHPLIIDGWSLRVLVDELMAFYHGRGGDLEALRLQPVDHACWEQEASSEIPAAAADFWKRSLAGVGRLDLPVDRSTSGAATHRGDHVRFALPGELGSRLEHLGREQDATLFMTLLAAWVALLHRYSGQHDIPLATVTAKRTYPWLAPLVGRFAELLPLRFRVSGDTVFREWLAEVRRTVVGAMAHGEAPLESVLEAVRSQRGGRIDGLFQTCFSFENLPTPRPWVEPSVRMELFTPDAGIPGLSRFDLSLVMAWKERRLEGCLEYSTDRFDRERIARMARHFEVLLESAVAEPETPLGRLPFLTAGELRPGG